MTVAFFWGFVAAFSLVVGGAIGLVMTPGRRVVGVVMAFGAGVLIAAIAFELVFEALQLARRTGFPALGFMCGALVFFVGDQLIAKPEGEESQFERVPKSAHVFIALILATILDGIPESMVIGTGVHIGSAVSVTMLVAVFVSNLPESIAATAGMHQAGWSGPRILALWLAIAVICAVASLLGYALAARLAPHWLAFTQTFAGGAILMMLANTMMPEAYERGGKLAGVFTAVGFLVSVWIIELEHAL